MLWPVVPGMSVRKVADWVSLFISRASAVPGTGQAWKGTEVACELQPHRAVLDLGSKVSNAIQSPDAPTLLLGFWPQTDGFWPQAGRVFQGNYIEASGMPSAESLHRYLGLGCVLAESPTLDTSGLHSGLT